MSATSVACLPVVPCRSVIALHDAAEMDMMEADQRRESLLEGAKEVGRVRRQRRQSGRMG